MGTIIEDLYDHEGWLGAVLIDGRETGTWGAPSDEMPVANPNNVVGLRPSCECGWRGTLVEHRSGYPDGDRYDELMGEWRTLHVEPLLRVTAPDPLAGDREALRRQLAQLVQERPLAALKELRQVSAWADALTRTAVDVARSQDDASWSEIAECLGISKQAAWERFAGERVSP